MKINNNILNATNLKNILADSVVEIYQDYLGRIVIEVHLKTQESGSIFCYIKQHIAIAGYTGNTTTGVVRSKEGFPAQMTEGARKIWDEFVKTNEKLLLDYIKNN